jgi:PPOX class probable F420-dependent enzyme
MSDQIPADFLDLLTEKLALAHFATLMPDGSPQVTPVWVDYEDGHILINGAKGRLKDANVAARPAVAVSITDPDNPFRYLAIRGRVVEIIDDTTCEHAARLTRKYTNETSYNCPDSDHVRRIYKIKPDRVAAHHGPNRHKQQE